MNHDRALAGIMDEALKAFGKSGANGDAGRVLIENFAGLNAIEVDVHRRWGYEGAAVVCALSYVSTGGSKTKLALLYPATEKTVPEWARDAIKTLDAWKAKMLYIAGAVAFSADIPSAAAPDARAAGDAGGWDTPIEELELSIRPFNCLKRANINTLGDLAEKTEAELANVRNLGCKSLEEIKERLGERGICLKPEQEVC
jgi:hypothetical protein